LVVEEVLRIEVGAEFEGVLEVRVVVWELQG
jgi:hypothetical protein